MGLFDTIRNTFGKGEQAADTTAAPSQLLREAGLNPGGLKFEFGTASITVSGEIAEESERQKILDVLSSIPGIDTVQDKLTLATADITEPAVRQATVADEAGEPVQASEEAEPTDGEVQTYTVVSGDTLWKIAERVYGNGSHYNKIFEANTDVLDHPDRIFPGQKLVIPKL